MSVGQTYPWLVCSALVACLVGCDGEKPPGGGSEAAAETCPREPAGDIGAGDANGDGAVDLADAVVILRHAAEGGAAPSCAGAVDLVPNDYIELDDAFQLLVHLYEGGFALPEDVDCGDAAPLPPPACSPVEARFSGTTLELRAETVAIEGWSVAVRAEGCTIAAATTAGTSGASIVDEPPGLRDLGYDATFVVEGGAVSAVVLGFMEPTALPAGAWSPVLALTVEPGGSCDCTLSLGEPLTGLGEPVENLVVAEGAAWGVTTEATIDACTSG